MNFDNNDYDILNEYDIITLKIMINKLFNINISINNKEKLIKKILKDYYIDNNTNTFVKRDKKYDRYIKKYTLLKSSFLAGNDNKYNIKLLNKMKKNI
jgi:hypothetical protein